MKSHENRTVPLSSRPDRGELACTCKKCSDAWIEIIALPMDFGEVSKAMRGMKCRACGSKEITLVFGDAAKAAGF